jgi:Flp pilus assembly protein TadD
MTTPAASRRHPRPALQATAVGFALLEAVSAQARTRAIDGLRISETSLPRADADAYQTGRSLLAIGDVTGAMAAFRQALVAAPQSIDALNGLGACYDRMGRYDLSRNYYDAALAIDPGAAITLNNLGYSLFLAADYTGAIPLLQRAAASDDAAVNRNARRLLVLAAERLRLARAATDAATAVAGNAPATAVMQIAIASPQPPARSTVAPAHNHRKPEPAFAVEAPAQLRIASQQAHIEQSSGGEQRLVLDEATPDAVLTASLGDDAVLVLVAPAWTARDDRQLAFDEATRLRLDARAAAADLAELFPAAPDRLAENSLAASGTTTAIAARFPVAAEARRPAAVATPPIGGTSQPVFADLPATARQRRNSARGAEALAAGADTSHDATGDTAPLVGWLLAGRSASGPVGTPRVASQGPLMEGAALAFDSDDGDLNAFAARMRGQEPTPVSNAEAVARLEALVARLRGA